jgi:hypothetical protein
LGTGERNVEVVVGTVEVMRTVGSGAVLRREEATAAGKETEMADSRLCHTVLRRGP